MNRLGWKNFSGPSRRRMNSEAKLQRGAEMGVAFRSVGRKQTRPVGKGFGDWGRAESGVRRRAVSRIRRKCRRAIKESGCTRIDTWWATLAGKRMK